VDDDVTAEMDADELDAELPPAPPGVEHCSQCTILIGPGYVESEPFTHPDARGYVCWRCYESLERRRDRRLRAEAAGQNGLGDNLMRRLPRL
jgi:hypothetical protein